MRSDARTLWLTGHGRHRVEGVIRGVGLPFVGIAGCPGGPGRKNVPARGGGCVPVHQLDANGQPQHGDHYTPPRFQCPQDSFKLCHHPRPGRNPGVEPRRSGSSALPIWQGCVAAQPHCSRTQGCFQPGSRSCLLPPCRVYSRRLWRNPSWKWKWRR